MSVGVREQGVENGVCVYEGGWGERINPHIEECHGECFRRILSEWKVKEEMVWACGTRGQEKWMRTWEEENAFEAGIVVWSN